MKIPNKFYFEVMCKREDTCDLVIKLILIVLQALCIILIQKKTKAVSHVKKKYKN